MKYSYILHTPEGNITVAEQVNPFEAAEPKTISLAPYDVQISSQEKGGCILTEIIVHSFPVNPAHFSAMTGTIQCILHQHIHTQKLLRQIGPLFL